MAKTIRKPIKAKRYNDPRCPECGGQLEIIVPCIVLDPYAKTPRDNPHRHRLARIAACTGCDFMIEF